MTEKTYIEVQPGDITWDTLKEDLMAMPKETVAEMVNLWVKTFWTLQSYWMVFTEEENGFDLAAKMDGRIWDKVGPAQAYRLVKTLGLGDDIQSLATLIKFSAIQWAGAGFDWEFTEVSRNRLTMTVHACPMGTYRKANNLELLPCKNVSPTLYGSIGKIINEKMECRCVHAHPDPPKEGVMCQWEYVLPE